MREQISELRRKLKFYVDEARWDEASQLLSGLRQADSAELYSELPSPDQRKLVPHLDDSDVAKIMSGLKKEDAAGLSKEVSMPVLSLTLDKLSPDRAADILRDLPEAEAQSILSNMNSRDRVSCLMKYGDESAGGRMTTEFVTLDPDMTAEEAISLLRSLKPQRETVNVLYVVDGNGRLIGTLTLRDLVISDPHIRIGDILESDVVSVETDTDMAEVSRLMERYDLTALPVVDKAQQPVGAVQRKASVDAVEHEATEEMYHMVGLSEHERVFAPMWSSVKRRLPWLCINLGTAVFAGFIVNLFESVIAKVVVLAAFIPIIAGQGGNAGAQTVTIIVRSLALGEISSRNALRALLKEVGLAMINGLVIGGIAGFVAYAWKGDMWLGVVLGVAMFLTMVMAGLSGAVIPLMLKLLRMDPALASTVLVTTVTDISGFLFLLGIAKAVENHLT